MKGNFPSRPDSTWNLFLGVAPEVEYHPLYHPFNWRGWVDWGQGALGDMGAHLDRPPGVGPEARVADGHRDHLDAVQQAVCFPNATTTYYEFAARGSMPAVKLTWYDGGLTPAKPDEMAEEERLNGEGGILYIGTKGKMLQNTYGGRPRLLPMSRHNSYGAPPEKLARIPHQSHEMNWVNAIRGREEIIVPVLVCRASDRDHAARRRRTARRHQAPLRRRQHALDEQRRRQRVPDAKLPAGISL